MKGIQEITLGVCYYPEHWDERLWEEDMQRMTAAGIAVIRIAEFAWNKFEIEEGIFDFSFFDRFMKVAEQESMKVIFCTPTATPPAWLTEKYPETLCVDYNGQQHRHGMRRQYNYNSQVYREKTKIIVEKIVEHYGKHPSIIGWQIDNELNCVTDEFYAEADHKAFREYVREKYKTIEKLNEAWGTVFWNQSYRNFEEIFLPRYAPRNTANPHLKLDSIRFFSDSAISYCKLQYDIIAGIVPEEVFITTNGIFKHIDYHKMVDSALDFITYDSYPTFGLMDPDNSFDDRKWSLNLTKVRGISETFGIMEQQAGPGGWYNYHKAPTPKPGQIRLWSYQSIAHGADFVSYFRWRTCPFGTEIYWYGILGYDNRNNRRLDEISRIGQEIKYIREVTGSRYQAKVAILYDYDNEWDGETDVWHGPVRNFSHNGWFQGLQNMHVPFDYLTINENTTIDQLEKYQLIITPHLTIVKEHMSKLLKKYVEEGGRLITGARSGYKDQYGQCPMEPMPVGLSDLFGATIDDFTLLRSEDHMRYASWGEDKIEMQWFNDIITPISKECRVMAVYDSDYYKGMPAITENRYGKGSAYYFGAAFSNQAVEGIVKFLGLDETYQEYIVLPRECEIAVRETEEYRYVFVLNYSEDSQEVNISEKYFELLSQAEIHGKTILEPYGVLVLRIKK